MSHHKIYSQIMAFALIFALGCASPAPEAPVAAEPAAEPAVEKIVAPVQPNVVKQILSCPSRLHRLWMLACCFVTFRAL
jgi:hypothetical protein